MAINVDNSITTATDGSKIFSRIEIICLVSILLVSLVLNVWNNDFPIGYHGDEVKKVRFIRENIQDFHHPILMLQAGRVLHRLFNLHEDLSIVIMGRGLSAFFGVLIVFFSYLIYRDMLRKRYALFAALAVAVSPTLVMHAHYLKEDMIFTCFTMFALYGFFRFIKMPCGKTVLLFGTATGLALSSQYKSILLIPMFFLIPILFRFSGLKDYYRKMIFAFIISLTVFLIINYPLFLDIKIFMKGVLFDKWHVSHGHDVVIPALPRFFTFHIMNSIVPGITAPLALLSLVGMIFSLAAWKKNLPEEKILIVYIILFYFITEATPLKPFPDFMRYMIPIIPPLLFFSIKGIIDTGSLFKGRFREVVILILCVITFAVPFTQTMQLVYHINKDTRKTAEDIISPLKVKTIYESYASADTDLYSITKLDIAEERKNGVGFLVASSFMYERFNIGVKIGNQHSEIYEIYKKYNELFRLPYREIRPVYKSYAFSNPTLRIIDIRKNR